MTAERTPEFETARELEESGEFLEASDYYLHSAFVGLHDGGKLVPDGDDEPATEQYLAVSELMRAVFCAVKSGDADLAERIQALLRSVAELLQYNTGDTVASGLLAEWIGDGYLILGSADAERFYRTAAEKYRGTSESDWRFWGMEPEFDEAYWVFEDFVRWSDVPGPNTDSSLQMEFNERIDFKRSTLEELRRGRDLR